MAGGRIYHAGLTGDAWTAMDEAPYEAEEILQRLLADHPDLLAGEQIRPGQPRRWLLIAREVGVPDRPGASDRWSLDHVFVDQDATPTLVEVKRSSNTQIRREIVGQILDYAANVVAHWPPGTLRELFEARLRESGADPNEALLAFLGAAPSEGGGADDVDVFWARADENLRLRQMRLLFVADAIPRELQRIVEFMNESMAETEVLAVEVRQYLGEDHRVLVPRVIGNTAAAEERKERTGSTRQPQDWTLEQFKTALAGEASKELVDFVERAIKWVDGVGGGWRFGHGRTGPFYLGVPALGGATVIVMSMFTTGNVMIPYDALKKWPPFEEPAERLQVSRRFNAIAGVSLPDEMAERATWPEIKRTMIRPAIYDELLDVFDYIADRLRQAAQLTTAPPGSG